MILKQSQGLASPEAFIKSERTEGLGPELLAPVHRKPKFSKMLRVVPNIWKPGIDDGKIHLSDMGSAHGQHA